jgi:hypothetical protein
VKTSEVHLHPRSPRTDFDSESTLGLIKRLVDELTVLFRQEVALAVAEVGRGLSRLAVGVVSVAAGAAVLFAGLLLLLSSAVLWLALIVAPWLAALIVGVVVMIAGLLMVMAGRKATDLSVVKPSHSPQSLRKDKAVLSGARHEQPNPR